MNCQGFPRRAGCPRTSMPSEVEYPCAGHARTPFHGSRWPEKPYGLPPDQQRVSERGSVAVANWSGEPTGGWLVGSPCKIRRGSAVWTQKKESAFACVVFLTMLAMLSQARLFLASFLFSSVETRQLLHPAPRAIDGPLQGPRASAA